MAKVEIPSASSMAELAEQKKQDYEASVISGPVFKDLLQRIETAALEGRTEITISLTEQERKQDMKVISKYLIAAGYGYKPDKSSFPFNLVPSVTISWNLKEKLEGR